MLFYTTWTPGLSFSLSFTIHKLPTFRSQWFYIESSGDCRRCHLGRSATSLLWTLAVSPPSLSLLSLILFSTHTVAVRVQLMSLSAALALLMSESKVQPQTPLSVSTALTMVGWMDLVCLALLLGVVFSCFPPGLFVFCFCFSRV